MKKLLTATALAAMVATTAQAKEINLECQIGDGKPSQYTINTDLGTFNNPNFGQGKLMTTAQAYSTMLDPTFIRLEVTINRETLEYLTRNAIATDVKKGTCKLIESKAKI